VARLEILLYLQCSESRFDEQIALVKPAQVRIDGGSRSGAQGVVLPDLDTVQEVLLELSFDPRGELPVIDDHVALGVVKRRPPGDVVGADGGDFTVDHQVLGVEGARVLPLEDPDALFQQPVVMIAALPVHPPEETGHDQSSCRAPRVRDEADLDTPSHGIRERFRDEPRRSNAVASPEDVSLRGPEHPKVGFGELQAAFVIRLVRNVSDPRVTGGL
jgi:hypothetical protein